MLVSVTERREHRRSCVLRDPVYLKVVSVRRIPELDDESKKRERSRDAPPAACIVVKAACRSARPVRRLGKGRSTGPTSGRAHLRGPHRLPGMCPSEPKQPKVFARRRWLALDYSGLREVLLERVTHPCTGSRVVYHHGITVKHSNLGLADCTSGLRTRRGASATLWKSKMNH
jgi:hypothetical protein